MKEPYLKEDKALKLRLRLIGKLATPIGLIALILGIVDFFSSANSMRMPQHSWLFFLAMPTLFISISCLSFGYMKEVNAYTASQSAPVQKGVINYMLDGTREEASKSMQQIVGAFASKATSNKICSKCGAKNELQAKFCNECGVPLIRMCPHCNTANDRDANYCDHCGKSLFQL